MDPGRREAVLAMADALATPSARGDVLLGYVNGGYVDLADAARWSWVVLVRAEMVVDDSMKAQKFDWFNRTYRDGEEI